LKVNMTEWVQRHFALSTFDFTVFIWKENPLQIWNHTNWDIHTWIKREFTISNSFSKVAACLWINGRGINQEWWRDWTGSAQQFLGSHVYILNLFHKAQIKHRKVLQ
jgi:hypothetical protein